MYDQSFSKKTLGQLLEKGDFAGISTIDQVAFREEKTAKAAIAAMSSFAASPALVLMLRARSCQFIRACRVLPWEPVLDCSLTERDYSDFRNASSDSVERRFAQLGHDVGKVGRQLLPGRHVEMPRSSML
jgi:hypothetical protein